MLLIDIARFLLDVLGSLLVGLLILRVWIHAIGMPVRNPVVQFVVALTGWLVRPLHRLLPARERNDELHHRVTYRHPNRMDPNAQDQQAHEQRAEYVK